MHEHFLIIIICTDVLFCSFIFSKSCTLKRVHMNSQMFFKMSNNCVKKKKKIYKYT